MEKKLSPELASVLQSIKDGEVYADVKSVSQSGLSRRILFYRIAVLGNKPYIERITLAIGQLSGALKPEQYKQHGKEVIEAGLFVSGCGMDMIFHTLYNCMPPEEAKGWKQKYNYL